MFICASELWSGFMFDSHAHISGFDLTTRSSARTRLNHHFEVNNIDTFSQNNLGKSIVLAPKYCRKISNLHKGHYRSTQLDHWTCSEGGLNTGTYKCETSMIPLDHRDKRRISSSYATTGGAWRSPD